MWPILYSQFWTLKNCAMAGRPCLTAFNSEAGLYLSHLRFHMLVMLFTKAQIPLVRFGVWASPWTYVLKADSCRSVQQNAVSIQLTNAVAWWIHSTLQLCHCVQRDIVDWAWGSVARSIGVSRYYLFRLTSYCRSALDMNIAICLKRYTNILFILIQTNTQASNRLFYQYH